MSWSKSLLYDEIPIEVHSNYFGNGEAGVTVGFRIKDEKTAETIRNRDPRLLEALANMLDSIDELHVVMSFCDHDIIDWNSGDRRRARHNLEITRYFQQKAEIVLISRFSSGYMKSEANKILNDLVLVDQEREEAMVRRGLLKGRRNEFAKIRGQLALALIHRDGYKCRVCQTTDQLTIDHIVPVSKGGNDDLDNLQWLCQSHNSQKGDRVLTPDLEEAGR